MGQWTEGLAGLQIRINAMLNFKELTALLRFISLFSGMSAPAAQGPRNCKAPSRDLVSCTITQ